MKSPPKEAYRGKLMDLFLRPGKAYGGELLRKRRGRLHGRPLSTGQTMHLVMRSTKAKGDWSFRRPRHRDAIQRIIRRFSLKYNVRILSMANVGNHLHLHVKLGHWQNWRPFIRAVTGSIMMAVTGTSRWQKTAKRFWDYRPFTRIVIGRSAFLRLRDYIYINQLEGLGFTRAEARFTIAWQVAEDADRRNGLC